MLSENSRQRIRKISLTLMLSLTDLRGIRVKIERKSSSAVRADFDKKSGALSRELSKLQEERSQISDAMREDNATAEQVARKDVLDDKISVILDQQARLNRERSVIICLQMPAQPFNTKDPGKSLNARLQKHLLLVYMEFTLYALKSRVKDVTFQRVLDLGACQS